MESKIKYRFTPIPTNLYLCLDINCRSVLVSLIQLSQLYATDNGWFFRTNTDLEAETLLSKNVLSGALDALYQEGIIDIIPQEKGKGVKQHARKYKVNFDRFRDYEKLSLEDCMKNPDYAITTCDYKHGAPSFQQSLKPTSLQTSLPTSLPTSLQSDNNIENIDIEENIENKYNNNIYNKREPNGNTEPNGHNSFNSSSNEASCSEPTVNSAFEDSSSFSDFGTTSTSCSEPTVIKPSCTIPTCSLSTFGSNSTTNTPKGVSADAVKVTEQLIPMDEETDGRQASYTNGKDGSITAPSGVWDGNSCAPQVQDWKRDFNGAVDILVDYDINHKQFDDKSYGAMKTAVSLARKIWGYDYDAANDFVKRTRKQHAQWAKEDAEVALVAEMLNDDPKPTETRTLTDEEQFILNDMASMFIDVDALDAEDEFARAW